MRVDHDHDHDDDILGGNGYDNADANGKKEESEEFDSVFAAWKKRDSGETSLLGSSISAGLLGGSLRSITEAGTKTLHQGARRLTSTTKRVASAVDDGAKKVASSTKNLASGRTLLAGTKKWSAGGSKREPAPAVTGKSQTSWKSSSFRDGDVRDGDDDGMQNTPSEVNMEDDDDHHRDGGKRRDEGRTTTTTRGNHDDDDDDGGGERPNNGAAPEKKSPISQPTARGSEGRSYDDDSHDDPTSPASVLPGGGMYGRTRSEVQSKIAARYQTEGVRREPTQPSPPPPPPPPAASSSSRDRALVLSPAKGGISSKCRAILSPVRTTRHFKANTSLTPRGGATKGIGGSLQDRIKLFSQSNASVPSWAMNIKSAEKVSDAPGSQRQPLTEERRIKSREKSKWRHEKRKQLQQEGKKAAAPARLQNVAAVPIQLADGFAPPSFPKSALDAETIAGSIRTNFMFEDLTRADLDTLVKAFEKVRVHAGEEVIRQGETGDFFYIIGKGQVSFLVDGKVVGSAGAGGSFGELALLYTSPRAATVVADSDPTHLYRVDRKSFRYIMQTKAREREGEKMELLRSIGFLRDFAKPDLERLCDCMVLRRFRVGELVVTKGEAGNAFYILKEGTVRITDIEAGGEAYDDVELRPGGYFGERALITSEPRAANVVGGSEGGSCFVIDRGTFERVLGKFSKVILKSQDRVVLEGIRIVREARLDAKVLDQLSSAIASRHFSAGQTIMEEDVDTVAGLYLVREGSVTVRRRGGGVGADGASSPSPSVKTIKAGGYFADEHLLGDALRLADAPSGKMRSQLTVVCDESCVCGLLTLKQCRSFMDTAAAFSATAAAATDARRRRSSGGSAAGDLSPGHSGARSSAIMQRRSTIKETFNSNGRMNMEELERDRLLGEGQFGQVWVVKVDIWGTGDEDHMEEFALKIQKWDCGDCSREYAASIQREKEVISSLEHPFIVDLVSSYEDEHESLMLMTIVEGGELWNVIHRERDDGEWESGISESHARFYSLVVAEALAYMHRRSVVFRDLKPENVLIDRDGYPNIIDFGFAKVVPEGRTFTFCGTPQYVAPEIILSKGHSFGVDHFALGVLVYEMVSGENPFYYDGLPTSELYEIISKEEPYPLAGPGGAAVSEGAKDLVAGLLVKDPNGRLGNLSGREHDILDHPWYADDGDLDLVLLKEKKIPAPFLPDL